MEPVNLNNIEFEPANHNAGIKKILKSGDVKLDSILQVACSVIKPNSIVEKHFHRSMNEYFLVTKGKGTLIKNEKKYGLKTGDFFIIKAKEIHSIMNTSKNKELELLYWGVKTE